MVNILDTWPEESKPLGVVTIREMVELREKVTRGFMELESQKGVYPEHVSMAMPATQDYARVLGFRFLEEVYEAVDADDRDHVKEELIDAVNYLLTLSLLDQNSIPHKETVHLFKLAALQTKWGNREITDYGMAEQIVHLICGPFAESLRNRSWMHNAQDVIWAGAPAFIEMAREILRIIMTEFDDWDDFYRFYIAKNLVLEFRLQSLY